MKTIILVALCSLSFSLFSQKTTFSGEIKNPFQETVYLRYYVQEEGKWNEVIVDSATLDEGRFRMAFDLDSLTSLQFYDGNEMAYLLMAPGENLSVSINTIYFDETLLFSGDGAARHNMMKNLYMIKEAEMNWIYGPEHVKKAEDTTKFFESLEAMKFKLEGFIAEMKAQLPEVKDELAAQKEAHFKSIDRAMSFIRKKFTLEKMVIDTKGQPFLAVKGIDLAGKKIGIDEFYGKPIVLDFWATWCGPCKYQFPYLHELETAYSDRFNFVSVGVWCKEDEWKKMATEQGFKLNIFLDKEEADKLKAPYLLTSIPRYMLLDAKGNLINVNASRPTTGLEDQLKEVLAEK